MHVPSVLAIRADSEKIKTHLRVRRRSVNGITLTPSLAAMAFGLVWLAWILRTMLSLGVGGLSILLFTEITSAPDVPGDGLANAITGSLLLMGMVTLIGTPLGILVGIYLAGCSKTSMLASAARFINGILLSVPPIVIDLFVYAAVVTCVQHLSGIADVITLALLQIPTVVCTAENTLNLMPNVMCEVAIALDTPKWKMVLSITLKASYAGVIAGALLAVACIVGEAASLLFVALNSQFWSLDPNQPVATLPIVIFKPAMGPFPEQQRLAWAGMFLAMLGMLGLNVLTRALFTKK